MLDQNQAELEELLIDNNSHFACLITAYNPRSNQLDLQTNLNNQQKLIKEFEVLNLSYLKAISIDPKNEWPEEEQLLVLDCAKDWEKNWLDNLVKMPSFI